MIQRMFCVLLPSHHPGSGETERLGCLRWKQVCADWCLLPALPQLVYGAKWPQLCLDTSQQSLIEPDIITFLPPAHPTAQHSSPQFSQGQVLHLLSLACGYPENNLSCLFSTDSYVPHNREESGISEDNSRGRGEAEGGSVERKRGPTEMWGRWKHFWPRNTILVLVWPKRQRVIQIEMCTVALERAV